MPHGKDPIQFLGIVLQMCKTSCLGLYLMLVPLKWLETLPDTSVNQEPVQGRKPDMDDDDMLEAMP